MKYRALLFSRATAALAVLAGCPLAGGKGEEKQAQAAKAKMEQNIQAGYTASMDIQYQDIEATAVIDQSSPGDYVITFQSPEAMNGMEFATKGEKITLSYRGLSASFTTDDFFNSAIAKQLIRTMNAVTSKEGLSLSMEEQALLIEGALDTGDFTLKIDRENGNFLHLSIPSEGLEVNFTNFQLLSR